MHTWGNPQFINLNLKPIKPMNTYKIKYRTVLNYLKGKRYQSRTITASNPATAEIEACKAIEGNRASLSKQIYDVQVWLNGKEVTSGCQ